MLYQSDSSVLKKESCAWASDESLEVILPRRVASSLAKDSSLHTGGVALATRTLTEENGLSEHFCGPLRNVANPLFRPP